MKNATIQLLAIFFILLTGCSKEKMVTEPTGNSVLKKGGTAAINEINFECVTISNDNFMNIAPGYLVPVRRVLIDGNFTGTLNGYGIISSRQSPFKVIKNDLLTNDHLYDPFTASDRITYLKYPVEDSMYKLTLEGNIVLNPQDYCSIRIEGNIYPICYTPLTSSEVGEFEGTGIIYSGTRKLAGLNSKKFRAYGRLWGYGAIFSQPGGTTGQLRLIITDNLVIN